MSPKSGVSKFDFRGGAGDALVAMEKEAKIMKLPAGVAFVATQQLNGKMGEVRFLVVKNTLVRMPVVGTEGDAGTNYFGVAMMKLAVMMAYQVNSGVMRLEVKKGEVSYRGGLMRYFGGLWIYVGFSGGTEEQDVEIAKVGLSVLLP